MFANVALLVVSINAKENKQGKEQKKPNLNCLQINLQACGQLGLCFFMLCPEFLAKF